MFIWLLDRSKNHSLPHHPHGADKEGGQHSGIIYVVSEGWDGDSHKGHCGVKEIVEAFFTSEQGVLFSTYWHLRTEKGKNSLFFTSWSKKPTANQMACIAFFTFGETMKSLSISNGIYTLVSLYQNLTHLISDSTISCINTKEANFIWSILYVWHDEYFESVKWEY